MAKLVACSLAAWLMVAVCSIQLVHAQPEIESIMKKQSELRSDDEWEILVEEADKALLGTGPMPIDTALEIFQDRSRRWTGYLSHIDADNLISITKNLCNDENVLTKGLFATLITVKSKELHGLYKHVKASLNHYMIACGLQDRYQGFLRRFLSNKYRKIHAGKELSLADRIMASSDLSPYDAIMLVTDRNFGLISEIKCDDQSFIDKIVRGLRCKSFRWLQEYSNDVLDEHLRKCGHEDNFKRLADEIFTGLKKEMTMLASYLQRPGALVDENFLSRLLKFLQVFASFDPSDKRNCQDFKARDFLADGLRLIEPQMQYHQELFDYVRDVFMGHVSKCGFKNEYKQKVVEFIENDPDNWRMIECWMAGKNIESEIYLRLQKELDPPSGRDEIFIESCRRFFDQTYGSLLDLVELRRSQLVISATSFDADLYQWLVISGNCAGREFMNLGYLNSAITGLKEDLRALDREDWMQYEEIKGETCLPR